MKTISKAIAGGMGAGISKITTQVLHHFFPDLDSAALEYVIYTLLTGLMVYSAPANEKP